MNEKDANLNENNVKLNDDELTKVTGGASETRGNHTFTGHIGKYDAVVGKKYYILSDDTSTVWYGELKKTWEKDFLWWTNRVHKFEVWYENFNYIGKQEIDFDGDTVSLYENCLNI